MTDEVRKLSSKLGIDTTDFKTAIIAANRELRVLESGFKAGSAGLGDYTKSATGLELRIKTLTSQMDIQKLKVEALRAEHARLVAEEGAGSRAAQEAEIKLNLQTAALGKMEVELRKTEVDLKGMTQTTKETSSALSGLKGLLDLVKGAAGATGKAIKASFSGVGTAVRAELSIVKTEIGLVVGIMKASLVTVTLFATAIVGVGAVMLGATVNTATFADQLGELSQKTGLSTTRLQEMQFAGKILGSDLELVTGALTKLTRNMASAADGTGTQADAFKTLGIRVTDANGKLRNSQTVFDETLQALRAIENPTQRDALAMDILGKSAQELNPLILAGADGLRAIYDEAHKVGAVLDEETIRAAGDFKDQLDGLGSGFQGVGMQISAFFLPTVKGIAGQVRGYLGELVGIVKGASGNIGQDIGFDRVTGKIIKGSTDAIGGVAGGIAGLVTRIVQDLAAGLPAAIQAGAGILKNVGDAMLAQLPTLVPVGLGMLNTLATTLVANLPALISVGLTIIKTLGDGIVAQLPSLVVFGLDILRAVFKGVMDALPTLGPLAGTVLHELVTFLVLSLGQINKVAVPLLDALVSGIAANLPMVLDGASKILQGLTKGLTTLVPMLMPAVVSILTSLISFLGENLPIIATAAIQILNALIQGILPLLPQLVNVALGIIVALANGLTAALPSLTPVVVTVLLAVIKTLLENLPLLIDAATKLILALAQGLVAALPILTAESPKMVNAIQKALIGSLPTITKAAAELVVTLAAGIIQNLPVIVESALQLIEVLYDNLGPAAVLGIMGDIARGMIDGLIQGFNDNWGSLTQNIASNFLDLIDYIKSLLGIASPSKVGDGLMTNFVGSMGTGGMRMFRSVKAQFGAAMRDLVSSLKMEPIGFPNFALNRLGLAGARAAGGLSQSYSTDNSLRLQAKTIIFQGQQTPGTVGASARQKARRY